MVLISLERWYFFLKGLQEVVAGWEFGRPWGLEAEMEKWCDGYLKKKAQVGWGLSNGFEEWTEKAVIFYLWFTWGTTSELLLLGRAFKPKNLGNIGPGNHFNLDHFNLSNIITEVQSNSWGP